jgi:hypothetical protein
MALSFVGNNFYYVSSSKRFNIFLRSWRLAVRHVAQTVGTVREPVAVINEAWHAGTDRERFESIIPSSSPEKNKPPALLKHACIVGGPKFPFAPFSFPDRAPVPADPVGHGKFASCLVLNRSCLKKKKRGVAASHHYARAQRKGQKKKR